MISQLENVQIFVYICTLAHSKNSLKGKSSYKISAEIITQRFTNASFFSVLHYNVNVQCI